MSTLRLYQVDFEPRDNFYIEDMESYLRTLSSTANRGTFNLNYIKLSMNIRIKLPLPQEKQISNTANYAIIEQDNRTYYFFVTDARWIARRTVELSLTLDTVETYFKDLRWSSKTQITRETRDRLKKLNTNYYIRKIDRYNEGLNPTRDHREKKETINSEIGGKWFLVYMSNPATTQDATGNPMFMGLLADTSFLIAEGSTTSGSSTLTLETNRIYWITDSGVGSGASVTIGNTEYKLDEQKDNTTKRVIAVYTTGSVISIKQLYYTGDTYPYSYSSGNAWSSTLYSGNRITVKNIRVMHSGDFTDYNNGITSLDKIDALNTIEVAAGAFPELRTTAFIDFDNSNSRLSKIIELPYAPVDITKKSDGTYGFSGCTFSYGYNIMKINAPSLTTMIREDKRLQDLLYVTLRNPTATDAPNIDLESKLYSSEFYDYAYYYDTDKLPLRLEDINTSLLNYSTEIHFNTTNTMNSDKQFYFALPANSYNEITPYELYMESSRSTERMILNDSYADYIKNGYNYDQWNQKRTAKLAIANTVISGAQAAVGLGLGAYSSGMNLGSALKARKQASSMFFEYKDPEETEGTLTPAYTQAEISTSQAQARSMLGGAVTGIGSLVISQGIGAINSAVNSAASIEASKQSFINAVNARSSSPIGASGSTPTDLFDNYSSNKLIRFEYATREEERKNIWNTLRTLGYAHPVQEIPEFDTRIYSNFVQCTPVFLNASTEIYKVYLDDITLRFQAGVTVKHNYKGKYDLYDEYENYETFIMEDQR